MVENGVKNGIWYKICKYSMKTKKFDTINDLIRKINNDLNKNTLILFKAALISMNNRNCFLYLLDVLKTNYDGKYTIRLTDLKFRWMMDKK